ALADLSRALALAPEDDEALYQRGLLRARRREYDQAIADFNRVLERNPYHLPSSLQRGKAHCRRNDHLLAICDYTEVLRHRATTRTTCVPPPTGRWRSGWRATATEPSPTTRRLCAWSRITPRPITHGGCCTGQGATSPRPRPIWTRPSASSPKTGPPCTTAA